MNAAIELLGGDRFVTLARAYGAAVAREGAVVFFRAQAHGGINNVTLKGPDAIGQYSLDFCRDATLVKIERCVPAHNVPRAFTRATGIDVQL